MIDGQTVSATEQGRVRVFILDHQLEMDIADHGTIDGLTRALGVDALNEADVQIVDITAIKELGLPDLLVEGYGVSDAQIEPLRGMLDAIEGTVAVIRSGAFLGKDVDLPISGSARLVATLDEPSAPLASLAPIHADSAQPEGPVEPPAVGPAPKSDARISGMVAMAVLLFLAVFVVIFVMIGG